MYWQDKRRLQILFWWIVGFILLVIIDALIWVMDVTSRYIALGILCWLLTDIIDGFIKNIKSAWRWAKHECRHER